MTSEYCAPGHPDRMCDCIVSHILDRLLEKDGGSRVALECQAKDNFISIAGEVTSGAEYSEDDIKRWTREAIEEVGYTHEYASYWGEDNVIDPSRLEFSIHISNQSPDIAAGVDRDGWGDQGIFWGCAFRGDSCDKWMPKDYAIAKNIGLALYNQAKSRKSRMGLDIKTQVTVADGRVGEIVVAVPYKEDGGRMSFVMDEVGAVIKDIFSRCYGIELDLIYDRSPGGCVMACYQDTEYRSFKIVVNGTGRYVRHSTAGDCGTTGRKLVADSYGGGCRIGGGCFWGKDPTKADVTLNVLARTLARRRIEVTTADVVECSISCCIGRGEIRVTIYDDGEEVTSCVADFGGRNSIIEELGLDKPKYLERCMNGIFR